MAAPPITAAERKGEHVGPPRPTKWLGLDGALALLTHARATAATALSPPGNWLVARDAHAAAVATLGALRPFELRQLRGRSVIRTEDGIALAVLGKGARPRSVPCYPQLAAVVRRWLSLREAHGPADREAPLFAVEDGSFLSAKAWWEAWLRVLRRVGLDTRLADGRTMGPHAARHTGVMLRYVEEGVLEAASRFAGHRNLGITYEHYFHLILDVEAARAKLHASPIWQSP